MAISILQIAALSDTKLKHLWLLDKISDLKTTLQLALDNCNYFMFLSIYFDTTNVTKLSE